MVRQIIGAQAYKQEKAFCRKIGKRLEDKTQIEIMDTLLIPYHAGSGKYYLGSACGGKNTHTKKYPIKPLKNPQIKKKNSFVT